MTLKPTGEDEDHALSGQRSEIVDKVTAKEVDASVIPETVGAFAPGLPVPLAVAAILLVGGVIAMGETERLMTGALTSGGSSRSINDIIGVAALSGSDAWNDWLLLKDEPRQSVAVWIRFHSLFDIAFYLGYLSLLRSLVGPVGAARNAGGLLRLLWLLLVLEIGETLLLLRASSLLGVGEVPGFDRGVLASIASAKWLTGASVVLAILADSELRSTLATSIIRVVRAVWEQRLSLVVVTAMGVLTLVPGPHIWDQLPDVERSWVDGDWGDLSHAIVAVLATAIVSVYLFVVGRLRSERVWTTRVGSPPDNPPRPPQDPSDWRWWFVPPLLVLAAAAVLSLLPVEGLVDWPDVLLAVAVPLIILALSGLVVLYYKHRQWLLVMYYKILRRLVLPVSAGLRMEATEDGTVAIVVYYKLRQLLRFQRASETGEVKRERLRTDKGLWQEPTVTPTNRDRRRALDVWVAGDVLAVSVVVIGGLGLVRSLMAPLLLGPPESGSGLWLVRLMVLLTGAVVAGRAFPLANARVRRLDLEPLPEGSGHPVKRLLRPSDNRRESRRLGRVAVILWLGAIAALVVLMVWPLQVTSDLGVVATTLLALGAWTAVLGFLIVHQQYHKPLPVFRALRMRTTPVLTLLLVVPLLASQGGGDPDLHALSAPPGGAPGALPNRPSLSEAFAEWVERSQSCDRPIDSTDGQNVRPMVLVAASGGGIRAVVWTAAVMEQLGAGGICASQAAFLSSGVSGGSVGLALSRGDYPLHDAQELAKPDALAAGIAGMLVGDLVAGSTGLRIPSLSLVEEAGKESADSERWDWRDRAGLMEAVWESKAESLTARHNQLLSGPAGVVVMNSAAAGRGCRVLISQVELATGPQETAETAEETEGVGASKLATCQGQTNQPAASLDLQDTYEDCTPDMSWATAAMLSARFPWILPAGRVPPVSRSLPSGIVDCTLQPNLQLIDGGYAEGSGIGTLADIAPALLQVVRDHNATTSDTKPFVIPVVLYLEDETRKDIVRQPQGLSPELFVPLAGRNAGAVQISSGTWLQRLSSSISDPCPPADRQRCLNAVDAIQGELDGAIVIAAPLTEPSVEAPLGWTLSEDSRRRLEEAAEAQATQCPTARPGGYPCLDQLLHVLQRTAPDSG